MLGNKGQLEGLLGSMQRLAEDVSDPVSQKAAFTFFARCVAVWAQPNPDTQAQVLPGFERFVYERLVPTAFIALSSPQFNVKDGHMLVVCTAASEGLQGDAHRSRRPGAA